jgi:hypothetical protein
VTYTLVNSSPGQCAQNQSPLAARTNDCIYATPLSGYAQLHLECPQQLGNDLVNLNQRNVLPKARPGCRAPKFNDNKLSIFSELAFGDASSHLSGLEWLWSRKHVLVAASSPRVDAHNRSRRGMYRPQMVAP